MHALFLITLAVSLWVIITSLITLTLKKINLSFILRIGNVVVALLIFITGFLGFSLDKTGLFGLPFSSYPILLSLNPLSNFFVFLLGLSYVGVSFFSVDYFKHFTLAQQKKIQFCQSLFVFAMLLVFTANEPITFLFSWELMALTSYFLVLSLEPTKQTRKAGFLYLSISHVGFFAIALSFFLYFSNFILHNSQPVANLIFIFAFIGFGAKAGLFPLHVWLPEAHPAAPSPISALMSGVMLKTAVYGLLKFTFVFLLSIQKIWWGYSLIAVGLTTMLIGVLHALLQTDMKRLLAYSSMENLGFIFTALGLAIIFYQYHQMILCSLALLVVLLHSLNHSLFKSLLFLGTGSILHATGERNLGKLGGLIHKMPWVSACTLIATLSMAGIPLFNGFISEWLYLSIFFHQHSAMQFLLAILSPLIIALSVLVFGLAGFVVVKFYGVAFLGQPREPKLAHAYPATWFERIGLLWLSLGCVLLGILPNKMIKFIQAMIHQLIPALPVPIETHQLTLHFVNPEHASLGFNPLYLSLAFAVSLIFIYSLFKKLSPKKIRRAPAWNGGFNSINCRMQDTSEGFSQPIKQIFSHLMNVKLKLPKPEDEHPQYASQVTEKVWQWFYFPLIKITTQLAGFTKWMRQGKISTYLLYIGITLFILLVWVA
ncbi:MAG: hypothetical protein A2330_11345 [Ignavibacteria bacterium RIFOXYB2_FULL_36_7]|nr:MAG: hypothetical protein A2330_11345 [Ignavibacteria bacterium RIFOXYB2_FULL_36_7]